MDFLAELGFALLPTAPAAGVGASVSHMPAGMAAGFAEHMRHPVEDALAKPQITARPAGVVMDGSARAGVRELGDLTRLVQSTAGAGLKPDAPLAHQILEPKPAVSSQQPLDGTLPHPVVTDVATAASALGTAPSGDDSATLETAEEQRSGRRASGGPEDVVESEAAPESPIPTREPLVAAPTETWLPNSSEAELAVGPSHHASAGTTPMPHGDEVASRSLQSGEDSVLPGPGVALPHREREPTVAKDPRDGKASTPLNGSGSTALQQHVLPSRAHRVGRPVEPEQTRNLAPDADGGNDAPSLEKPVGHNSGSEPVVRRIEEGGSKPQPLSDSQIVRLPNSLALQGSGGATPHPAGVAPTETGLVISRGPDGAVSVEAPAHAHQVALHITKTLDQDKTAIRIELDPPELGEVDIDLEFRDLRLTATVRAERSDVLDLLQRDVRTLARALREAGVELADSDISFHSGRSDHGGHGTGAQRAIGLPRALEAAAPLQDLPAAFDPLEGFVSLSDGRLDLRV